MAVEYYNSPTSCNGNVLPDPISISNQPEALTKQLLFLFATLLQVLACSSYICRMPRFNLDALGIATSLACAIHCAVLPLILTSLPVFGMNIIENFVFENFMIVLAFAIGVYSLWHGFRKHHHSFMPLTVFSAGILLLVAKQIWHQYQLLFLPLAVLLIISAHLMNYRWCRIHNHAHADDCDH